MSRTQTGLTGIEHPLSVRHTFFNRLVWLAVQAVYDPGAACGTVRAAAHGGGLFHLARLFADNTVARIAIGLAGSFMLSTMLAKLIYGIRPSDPATFGAVALILAAVAVVASVIPAWRATRVEPVQVLLGE